MNRLTCPRCGSNLREDVWERNQTTEDGGVKIDVHPVYKCTDEDCGYMKRSESVPEIIAQQGEDRLLLKYPDEQGRIVDVRNNVIWPSIHYLSILGRGYWDDYKGNHDVEMILANVRDSEAAFLEQPNLFEFATSELSQDAFLCWLLAWSKKEYRSIDKALHEAAVDFVTMIFNVHGEPLPVIEKIKITRQFEGLDVLAVVNDTYAILIEDKTYTRDHSNQLKRYRESVFNKNSNWIQLPVYYKIVDQTHYQSVENAGYYPFMRERMLQVLRRGKENGVVHPIYLDYLTHLEKLDDMIHAYITKPVAEWDGFAWQGFYIELQKEIKGNWGYVSNPRGGFWGFWWKPSEDKNYYLQLEEQSLCVKIEALDREDIRTFRDQEMVSVLEESNQRGLLVQKPSRIGLGKTMSIAHRPDYIQTTEKGLIDIKGTIAELKKWDTL